MFVGASGVGRVVRTDATGCVSIPDLPAGIDLSVVFDVWSARNATLVAEEWTEVILDCAPPVHLRVAVVDGGGLPLRGVTVVAEDENPGDLLARTAESGPDGTCRFERIYASGSVRAEHDGRHGLHAFALLPPGSHEVRLVLEDPPPRADAPSGTLDVVVADAVGRPVVGAEVQLMGSRRTVSASGRARFDAVRVGTAVLSVASESFAPWSEEIELRAGANSVHPVLLEPAVLEVRVVTERDVPVPFAVVAGGRRASQSVRANPHGIAELRVPPGECVVTASSDNVGQARTMLQLAPRQRTQWVAVLEPGRVVEGQVVDLAGQPMAEMTVSMRGGRDRTDPAGRFRMTNVDAGEQLVTVARDDWFAPPLARVRVPAGPQAEPLVIRVDPSAANAGVRARLAFANPGWRSMLWVMLESEGLSFSKPVVLGVDNTIRVDGLLPSAYVLRIFRSPAAGRNSAAGMPAAREFGPFPLRSGQQLDLGTLTIPAACDYDLRLDWPTEERERVRVELFHPDGSLHGAGRVDEDRVVLFSPPAAGRYFAVVRGQGMNARAVPVVFRPDAVTRYVLRPRRIAGTELRIEFPDRRRRSYALRVFDQDGEFVTAGFGLAAGYDRFPLHLVPGSYRFVVECDGERRELAGRLVAEGAQPQLVIRF